MNILVSSVFSSLLHLPCNNLWSSYFCPKLVQQIQRLCVNVVFFSTPIYTQRCFKGQILPFNLTYFIHHFFLQSPFSLSKQPARPSVALVSMLAMFMSAFISMQLSCITFIEIKNVINSINNTLMLLKLYNLTKGTNTNIHLKNKYVYKNYILCCSL